MSSLLDGDLRYIHRTPTTISPSDSQSNWLNITKTNWTHILFPLWFSQSICIGISVPQLLIYISSQPSKWVVPIGFAPSMRQRPTQHFISWKPLSARRPQAPESDFFSFPVGSIYIRRENPLQPQSFQTHVRDSGQNVRAVKHFTTGGGK